MSCIDTPYLATVGGGSHVAACSGVKPHGRVSRNLKGQKAVESAALEAAGSSNRGSGCAPSGWASPWECRAAQSRQVRPEEEQEASWGAAKGAL